MSVGFSTLIMMPGYFKFIVFLCFTCYLFTVEALTMTGVLRDAFDFFIFILLLFVAITHPISVSVKRRLLQCVKRARCVEQRRGAIWSCSRSTR